MRNRSFLLVLSVLFSALALIWIGCGDRFGLFQPTDEADLSEQIMGTVQPAGKIIPGRYIVVLNRGASPGDVLRTHGLAAEHIFEAALNGFSATIPAARLAALQRNPRVAYVEADQEVTAFGQTLPAGVDRIDADLNGTAKINGMDEQVNVDIAIIDTGIELLHPDLNVYKNVTFVKGTKNGNDDNGHGTHVAGIAAAKDNSAGVVGVSPGARLWAVKVLDRNGNGYMSGVIKGVDYVTANASYIDVANMSLGGGISSALNTAIYNSVAKGVVYAVAAGNSGTDAANTSPASSPDVLAVSAIVDTDGKCGGLGTETSYGADDTFAAFSNFGSVVDIAAPGMNIYSTYKGRTYATMSGTSMASPHVAGAAGLYVARNGKPTSSAGAATVRSAIIIAGAPQAPLCPIDASGSGGFTGDPDSYPEPMVNAKSL